MKAGMFLCLLSFVLFKAEAKTRWPEIKFYRIEPTPTTVYYGETTVVRYIMESRYMKNSTQWWTWPQGITSIRTDYNQCPPFYLTTVHMMNYNYCAFSVLVYGSYFGQVIAGSPAYHLTGGGSDLSWIDLKKVLPAFTITVIPHPISFTLISQQKGTVNTPFYFDLKSLVNYYQENVNAGVVPVLSANPSFQDGLYYDPASSSIQGIPTRTGLYQFQIQATNAYKTTNWETVTIHIGVNPLEKPVFKATRELAAATAGKIYQLNLMDLIEPRTDFSRNNQVYFRINPNSINTPWFRVEQANGPVLLGQIPEGAGGQSAQVELIATSNTGGDSEPARFEIPVALEPEKKPRIEEGIHLRAALGQQVNTDLRSKIIDPTQDVSLRLILDKVEPAAPWLRVSTLNSTALDGIVPLDAEGVQYELTFIANTRYGGNSEPVKIPLSIAIDKEKTPRFKSDPVLPMAYIGQPFFYDFAAHQDIWPDYKDFPYHIELLPGYNNPPWLRVEGQRFISDRVIDEEENQKDLFPVYLRITNVPGGSSEVIKLIVEVMK